MKQQNDLDAMIAAAEELKRFKTEQDVAETVAPSKIAVLNQVFDNYRSERKSFRLATARKQLELAETYAQSLIPLQGEDPSARAELDRLQSMQEVVLARIVVEKSGGPLPIPADSIVGAGNDSLGVDLSAAQRDGLLFYLPLDGTDPRIMSDASARGVSVDVHGGTATAEGRIAGALALDGVRDSISVPHPEGVDLSAAVSVCLWVKLAAWQDGAGLCVKGTGGGDMSVLIDIIGDKVRFVRWNPEKTAYFDVTSNFRIRRDTWQHIAAVADEHDLRLYVDGMPAVSGAVNGAYLNNHAPFVFGVRQKGPDPSGVKSINGLVDEVLVYNRALSEKEVRSLIQAGNKK
jgi:hypothetical protein